MDQRPGSRRRTAGSVATLLFLSFVGASAEAVPGPWARTETREACANFSLYRQPLFGDTHVHTAYSSDAVFAGTREDPRGAYRFAQGQSIGLPPFDAQGDPTRSAQLRRPLDFTAVTDHAEQFGEIQICQTPGLPGYDSAECVSARAQLETPPGPLPTLLPPLGVITFLLGYGALTPPQRFSWCGPGGADCLAEASLVWQDTQSAAEEFYDRSAACSFTSFVGYEWSGQPAGNNLHRNVIYRDGGDKAIQADPFTVYPPYGSDNPANLWKWMQAYEDKSGGRVLAIAHNGNLSNGLMFPVVESFGQPVDRAYAEARARWERLYEVTQTKGTGEAHPVLSPTDEFANFEIWEKGNLDGSVRKTPEMLEFEYARAALKTGLKLEQSLGTNPHKFGLIGSSDAHNGLSALAEDDFFGKTVPQEPSPERMTKPFVDNKQTGVRIMDWEVSASGYAAVWATDNSREALWDAMQRRETYATTGPRMAVRFFGGWEFAPGDAHNRLPAAVGYAKGVPMGGDLRTAPDGKSPSFLVAALKDPLGANLDRIQVVKGWMDADGALQEKVYDVAWGDADKRRPGRDGKVPAVGSTVDIANASWSNTIGDPELIAVWKDPDFDAAQRAFYYARVIEIPTPRWTAYDAKYFGVKPPAGTTMVLQERAYTAPIWYTP